MSNFATRLLIFCLLCTQERHCVPQPDYARTFDWHAFWGTRRGHVGGPLPKPVAGCWYEIERVLELL